MSAGSLCVHVALMRGAFASTMSATATASRAAASQSRKTWFIVLARAGFAARGVVYLIVGGLALLAALGLGGGTTGSTGAIQSLARQTWGEVALIVLGVGLLGHAMWRFFEGAFYADKRENEYSSYLRRAGLIVGAATYAMLGVYTLSLVIGTGGSSGGEEGSREATAWLMSKPFGLWLVGTVGVVIVIVGLAQFGIALRTDFNKKLDLSSPMLRKLSPLRRAGFVARAVTFVIIGAFVVLAAVQADPDEARGMGGALATLQQQAYGPWLLGFVSLGFIAFGIYAMLEALYRRISH